MINHEQKVKLAKDNSHISTEVIKQDIIDTEKEIETLNFKTINLLRTEASVIGYRMNEFAERCFSRGIEDRKKFVEKLKAIIEIRENYADEI